MQSQEDRRKFLARREELHGKTHDELIALASSYWPKYRAGGVDDETLIGDILDEETYRGFFGGTQDVHPENCHTNGTSVLAGVLY